MKVLQAALATLIVGTQSQSSHFVVAQDCEVCDDKPTPIMISKGGKCGDYPNIISTRCKEYENWRENQFCRQTCFLNGRGYDGDNCCLESDKSVTQTNPPTSSPTLNPTDAPAAANCARSGGICDPLRMPCCASDEICASTGVTTALGGTTVASRCIKINAPTDSPIASPVAAPEPIVASPTAPEINGGDVESSCTVCDDMPTPNMIKKNKPCSAFPNVIATSCNQYDNWKRNKFCRYTCFKEGRGYDNDDCCPQVGDTIIPPIPLKPEDDKNNDDDDDNDDDNDKKNNDDDDDDDKKKDEDDEKDDDKGGKSGRLKMYCKDSFQWQGNDCRDWCLECSRCSSGASLRIRKCSGSSRQKWKKDGNVLRPACSSSLYVSNGELKKGSGSLDGLSSNGKPFEIKKSGGCFTNHHHPRDGEYVSFRSCDRARRSDTSKWIWA